MRSKSRSAGYNWKKVMSADEVVKITVSFTYQIKPEGKLFVVKCLDWDCVFSQGYSIEECKKNIIELTEYYLNELKKGNLHKSQYPAFKPHKATVYNFQLDFDIITIRTINTHKLKSFKNITPATINEMVYA